MDNPVGKEVSPKIGPLSADSRASRDGANSLAEQLEFTPAELEQLSQLDDQWREERQRGKFSSPSLQSDGSSISDQGSMGQTGEKQTAQASLHELIKHLHQMRPQAARLHTGVQDPGISQAGFSQASDSRQVVFLELSPGAMIGDRYQVTRTLGRGGMGMVYLCRHLAMGHQVAIKLLPADRLQDPAWLSQFTNEARVSAAVNHPHIVRVFECDNFEGRPFLVMEYVEGITLQQWREETDPCCPYEVAGLIQQAAYALQHAHQCGLIHRDIKPANLMLTREQSMKVLDLGISKLTPECAAYEAEADGDRSTVPLGTKSFVAPELLAIDRESAQPDARSDIYALGCTWYWLLTHRLPHAYEPNDSEMLQHWRSDLHRLRRSQPRLPDGMLQLLGEMLHPVRSDRIASMENVATELNRLVHRRPVGSKRSLPLGGAWARWLLGSAILGLLLLWPAQALWKYMLPPHQRLHQELVAVNAGLTLDDVEATWEGGRLVALRLPAAVVKDVSPLASYPFLNELNIQSQANSGLLSDLSPCIHLPLRVLELAGNPLLRDLTPLSGLPIEILNVDRTATEELPELPQLRMLFAGDSKLRSLESLSSCPGLELLYVENTIVADLQPIAHAPLRNVQLLRTDVRSLAPLQGKPLEYINLSNTQIADLSALHGAPLEKLTIMFGTKVNSLEPLRGSPIKVLQVENSLVEDWTVLKTLPLEELTIDWNTPPSNELKSILSAHPTLQVINGISKDRYLLELNGL